MHKVTVNIEQAYIIVDYENREVDHECHRFQYMQKRISNNTRSDSEFQDRKRK